MKEGLFPHESKRKKAALSEESTSASTAANKSSELKGAPKTDRVEISDAAGETTDQEHIKRDLRPGS